MILPSTWSKLKCGIYMWPHVTIHGLALSSKLNIASAINIQQDTVKTVISKKDQGTNKEIQLISVKMTDIPTL